MNRILSHILYLVRAALYLHAHPTVQSHLMSVETTHMFKPSEHARLLVFVEGDVVGGGSECVKCLVAFV